jgi:hypothetical protein
MFLFGAASTCAEGQSKAPVRQPLSLLPGVERKNCSLGEFDLHAPV